jgi:hypothetical protein
MVHTTIRIWRGGRQELFAVDDAALGSSQPTSPDAGWSAAMAGAHVAHVASPVPMRTVEDPITIVPARDGTLRALRAAKAAGSGVSS